MRGARAPPRAGSLRPQSGSKPVLPLLLGDKIGASAPTRAQPNAAHPRQTWRLSVQASLGHSIGELPAGETEARCNREHLPSTPGSLDATHRHGCRCPCGGWGHCATPQRGGASATSTLTLLLLLLGSFSRQADPCGKTSRVRSPAATRGHATNCLTRAES